MTTNEVTRAVRAEQQAAVVCGRMTTEELPAFPGTRPAGPAVSVVHRGPYDTVAAAYELLVRSVTESGGRPAGAPWESYLDEPNVPDPRTEVVLPYTDGPSQGAPATAS